MHKVTWRLGLACVALSLLAGVARAQDAKDPEAALKEINAWYTDQLNKAREEKKQPDFRLLMTGRTDRAKAAVKDVDPEKAEPAKGFALAELYQIANDYPHAIIAVNRFLTSNPEGKARFDAQMLLLSGYSATNDAEGLLKTLETIKPIDNLRTAQLAANTASRYAGIVAQKKGTQAGLDLIAKTEAAVPFAEMLDKPDVTGPNGKPALAPERMWAEIALSQAALGRSALLEKAGKPAEALEALKAGRAKLPKDSRYASGIDSKLALATLKGSVAPPLIQERGYGGFKSLNDYKGKVVVVEFTAHW